MSEPSIRPVDGARDAAACAGIYRPYVADSPVSFEEEPPDAAEMERRIISSTATHPWVVAELDGTVRGFAYACEHRRRPAYRWAADVSVYVEEGSRRLGLGAALYRRLLELLTEVGFHVACAGITLPNEASVALHESFGFEPVGVYRGIGWKLGAWYDVGWWQLRLRPRDGPPAEPSRPRG